MKKIICGIVVVMTFIFGFIQPINAQEAFIIDQARIEMNVHEDGAIDVVEVFDLNFSQYRHGMIRYIPNTYTMQMNEDGKTTTKKYFFPVSNVTCGGECEVNGSKDGVTVRLGDPDREIIGEQQFKISYRVQMKDLRLKSKEQVLYWNLLSGFDTQTKKLTYKITMPKAFDTDKVYTYTGTYGGYAKDLTANVEGNIIKGETKTTLYNYDSATIRVNLPDNYFQFPKPNDYTLTASLISIALLLICFILFIKFGKDDDVIVTVEVSAPEGINSAEAGFIIDDTAQNKDILSLIIDWANRGFLKIYDKKEGFELEKLKDMNAENSKGYERVFFRAIFESEDRVNEQDLKDQKVGRALNQSKNMLTNYFHNNKKRNIYQTSSLILQIVMALLAAVPGCIIIFLTGKEVYGLFSIYVGYMLPAVILGISGIIWFFIMRFRYVMKKSILLLVSVAALVLDLLLLSASIICQYIVGVSWIGIIINSIVTILIMLLMIFMDKRSKQGNQWLGQILGFKDFIINCEKEQLEMMVHDDPSVFYSILPYAYVLGVSDVWVKKFESIAISSPDWYSGYNGNTFTTILWWNHFHYCFNDITTAATYVPAQSVGHGGGSFGGGGFSGGGFSGGGFGGGGGGSW